MKVSAQAFSRIIKARGMSLATLARRSGVPNEALDAALKGQDDLSDEAIVKIAKELAVPIPALFTNKDLPLVSLVDFRAANPGTAKLKREALQAVSFVEKISSTFAALSIDLKLDKSLTPISTNYTPQEAIKLAAKWRKKWGVGVDDQLEMRDANKLYASLRGFIENLGVIVLHKSFDDGSFSGFYTNANNGLHVIVINTRMCSKARKLFTLAHEFCHVLLRKEGTSNPSITSNKVEKFCNKFAAYLLAPDQVIYVGLDLFRYNPSSDPNFIRIFAAKLGISQEALVWRLVETGHLTRRDLDKWRATFHGPTPPGDLDSGGGGQSDPLQVKRTMYGSLLLRLLGGARRRGELDEVDIYRLCGLKPKYQNQLFEAV